MNVGGDDGGARLAVAEGVVLREACVGETTNESRDNGGRGGGHVSCLPNMGGAKRSQTAGRAPTAGHTATKEDGVRECLLETNNANGTTKSLLQ